MRSAHEYIDFRGKGPSHEAIQALIQEAGFIGMGLQADGVDNGRNFMVRNLPFEAIHQLMLNDPEFKGQRILPVGFFDFVRDARNFPEVVFLNFAFPRERKDPNDRLLSTLVLPVDKGFSRLVEVPWVEDRQRDWFTTQLRTLIFSRTIAMLPQRHSGIQVILPREERYFSTFVREMHNAILGLPYFHPAEGGPLGEQYPNLKIDHLASVLQHHVEMQRAWIPGNQLTFHRYAIRDDLIPGHSVLGFLVSHSRGAPIIPNYIIKNATGDKPEFITGPEAEELLQAHPDGQYGVVSDLAANLIPAS